MNIKISTKVSFLLAAAMSYAQAQSVAGYETRIPVAGRAADVVRPGKLDLTPATVVFSNAPIGALTEQQIVLTNTGGSPVALAAIEHSGPFSLAHDCRETLSPGQSCTATLTFSPSNATTVQGSLDIRANVANLSVPVSGAGRGVAFDVSTPGPVSFGSVSTGGTSSPRGVGVLNIGSVALTLNSVTVPDGFNASHDCADKAPGDACTINVSFKPLTAKPYSGNLTIGAAGTSASKSIGLQGTGVIPAFEIKANGVVVSTYDFGEVGVEGTSGQVTFSIKNTAGAPVTFGPKKVFVSDAFTETGSTCTSTLAVGATCTVNVTFAPTAVESYSGKLEIDSDTSAYTPVTLSGKGIPQNVSSWTLVDYPATLPTAIWDIQYANGMYVAVGDGSRLSVGSTLSNLHSVYYTTGATGTYLAVRPYRDSWIVAETGYARTLTWKGLTPTTTSLSPTAPGAGTGGFGSLETDGNRIVAGTSYPTYNSSIASNNGVTWQSSGSAIPYLGSSSYINSIKYVGKTWIAAGNSSNISVSTDGGLTWAQRGIGISPVSYEAISRITYGRGLWVMVTDKGRIFTSPNATNWTLRTVPSGVTGLNGVEFGPGGFVAVGAAGVILHSTDGATWTKMTSPFGTSVTLRNVKYLNGQWVIVSSTRQFAVSNP